MKLKKEGIIGAIVFPILFFILFILMIIVASRIENVPALFSYIGFGVFFILVMMCGGWEGSRGFLPESICDITLSGILIVLLILAAIGYGLGIVVMFIIKKFMKRKKRKKS